MQNQYLSSNEMRSAGGALDFSRVDGVPFKVTLLNDIGRALRARALRAREARASRAFYFVNGISPRTWREVAFWSGRAFLLFLANFVISLYIAELGKLLPWPMRCPRGPSIRSTPRGRARSRRTCSSAPAPAAHHKRSQKSMMEGIRVG